jgi:hypothetical protein
MDMITSAEVVRRIELYFAGGVLKYLSSDQGKAARRGTLASASNQYDDQPLTLHNARTACERFIKTMPAYPGHYQGHGIVICGGGIKYFPGVWVCINMLRQLGCRLPIQVWHLGKEEMDEPMKSLLTPFDVETVDATLVRRKHPMRRLGGWELKPYAILHSPFRHVMLLDADNVPVVNPEFLFATTQLKRTGAIFWPDYGQLEKTNIIWENCGLPRPPGPEFESGQMVVDKQRCWKALCLCLWFNANSDFYYQHLHGDKETFHLAYRKLNKSFSMVPKPIHRLEGTMCQHDFRGHRIFQHRNTDKWNLFLRNKTVDDFWFEKECFEHVAQLQEIWDGRMGAYRSRKTTRRKRIASPPKIKACMISCPEREQLRRQTLQNLAATDWGDEPVLLQIDPGATECWQERQQHTTLLALEKCLQCDADYVLFLEDDLEFNLHLRHNLDNWSPLKNREATLAGLYNPNLQPQACDVQNHALIVAPHSIYGSQAFVISRATVEYLVRHWSEVDGMQDIKMSRLAGGLKKPLFYHAPSLIQHVGTQSVWGGVFHRAADFDPLWKV